MEEIVVHKVVRRTKDGRMMSAILPSHLAETYRDAEGQTPIIKSSLAFAEEHHAQEWVGRMRSSLQQYPDHFPPDTDSFEIVTATAREARPAADLPVIKIVARLRREERGGESVLCIDHQTTGATLTRITEQLVSREEWDQITEACRQDEVQDFPFTSRDPYGVQSEGALQIDTLHAEYVRRPPAGTILCTDLRLRVD